VYYKGTDVLADFEIIPILTYLKLSDPWSHLTTGGYAPDPRSHSQKNLASDNLDMNDLKI
jgi:hypothetical protein